MFNDYEVVHESRFGLLPEVMMGIIVVTFILFAVSLVAMAIVYKKAGKPWWTALIPIYNLVIELQLATMPSWTIILLFIPLANLVVMFKAKMNLATAFNKKKEFGIGLALLPFVFYPILAFGKNEYRGINNEAFETYAIDPNATVKDITIEDINQEPIAEQTPISTGTGEKSSIQVPDELKASPLPQKATGKNELPPQGLLAGFRVEKKEKPNFVLSEKDLPTEAQVEQTVNNPKEIASIQDFYSNMKETASQPNPQNPAQQIANPTTPNIEGVASNEYITCPKCNAKIKKGASQCFLCGTKLDQ